MTARFPPHQKLLGLKSLSWGKKQSSCFCTCVSPCGAQELAHGGKMALNETNAFLEILKSFNVGKWILTFWLQRFL